MDGAKGFPHAAHDMCRLRGNRDDFAALALAKSTACRTSHCCAMTRSRTWIPTTILNKKIPSFDGIFLFNLVGAKGFEPSTPWSQTKYSTRLSYAPKQTTV